VSRVRLLVLGSGGFLGRHIVEAARAEDLEVIAHTRRAEDSAAGPSVRLDLEAAPTAALSELLRRVRPEVVVNAIGLARGHPQAMQATNLGVVRRLLDALAETLPATRFVQLGSAAEYAPVEIGQGIAETARAEPTSDYGRSKLLATQSVLEAIASGRLDAVVLRIFNPVGRGMSEATLAGRALALMRDALRRGDPTISLGPLDDYRDFIDARDVGSAVVAAVDAREPLPHVVNIGSGVATEARVLVQLLARGVGFTGSIREDQSASDRSAAVMWQRAEIRLAERALGWEPQYRLEEAVDRMAEEEC